MPKTSKPAKPETPKATTADELRASRVLTARVAPSGNRYDVRPLNLERLALSGGLPARLRHAASRGAAGVNDLLASDEDERLSSEGADVQEWLDRLCAEVIVSPSLYRTDAAGEPVIEDGQKVVDAELIDLLPPIDYKWAIAIALGEEDEDGVGARLWGREPLSRWAVFRSEHGCDEDCPGCHGVVAAFSASV